MARAKGSGRRPGAPDTRAEILSAARTEFAAAGFERTTVRAVAARAGVDPALIHHYFGSKRELFSASLQLPVDPTQVIAPLLSLPLDRLAPELLATILGVWESPLQPTLIAAFRATLTESDGALLRTFILEVVLDDLVPIVEQHIGSGRLRVQFVASQIAGLVLTRYILRLEPLAALPVEQTVAVVAPNLQRYLTEPLP